MTTSLSKETRMRMPPMLCVMLIAALVSSCSNPSTPAGYVGYVVKEPEGVARAMAMIKSQLTAEYMQYEAIKAQLGMVSSPNHTVMYIPVGPMGVPLVGTIDMSRVPPSGK